jgi:hypothetical protein
VKAPNPSADGDPDPNFEWRLDLVFDQNANSKSNSNLDSEVNAEVQADTDGDSHPNAHKTLKEASTLDSGADSDSDSDSDSSAGAGADSSATAIEDSDAEATSNADSDSKGDANSDRNVALNHHLGLNCRNSGKNHACPVSNHNGSSSGTCALPLKNRPLDDPLHRKTCSTTPVIPPKLSLGPTNMTEKELNPSRGTTNMAESLAKPDFGSLTC